MKTPSAASFVVMGLLAATACNSCKSTSSVPLSAPPGVEMERLTVTSRSFASNGAIPVDYTCDGADRSPQLTWSSPPPRTKAFAILVDDPDAPGGDFIHWVAFNLRGDLTSLPEAADVAEVGGIAGTNGFKRPGYNGPCPPKFELHNYAFHVYALDAPISVRPGANGEELQAALNGHVLAEGTLIGTFSH